MHRRQHNQKPSQFFAVGPQLIPCGGPRDLRPGRPGLECNVQPLVESRNIGAIRLEYVRRERANRLPPAGWGGGGRGGRGELMEEK